MKKAFWLLLMATAACNAYCQTKQITRSYVVPDQSVIIISTNYIDSPDCLGLGTIDIEVSGGVGAYTFSWTGPNGFTENTEDISELTQNGDYEVTVDDGNGCPATQTFNLPYSCPYTCSGFLVNVVNSGNLTTCSANDGMIEFSIGGGSGTYEYALYRDFGTYTLITDGTDNTGSLTFNNLSQGYYTLEVYDPLNACTAYGSANLSSPFYLYDGTYYYSDNTDCASPNGSFAVAVIGAQSPEDLTYEWTGPMGYTAGTSSIDFLTGGTYTLKVTDNNNGCNLFATGNVYNASSLDITVDSKIDASRCDVGNGSIDITVSGGSGTYTTSWTKDGDPSFSSSDVAITDLSPGDYTVQTYDAASACSQYKTVTIADAAPRPAITLDVTNNSNCVPPYNGSVNSTLTGRPGPFSYAWTDYEGAVISTDADPSGLSPGVYGYRITDTSIGCDIAEDASIPAFEIEDFSTPSISDVATITDNTVCNAPFNGEIDLAVDAAGASYTATWSGPNGFTSTSEDLTNLEPGTYSLVLDVSCSDNVAPVILSPGGLSLSGNFLTLDLLSFISDADNNLVPASIEVIEEPISGANAGIEQQGAAFILTLDYSGITYDGTDQFRLRACDALNACTENNVMVVVDVAGELKVYNAVSPNGDNANAFMRITGLPSSANKITIFNRWGDVVFTTEGYDNNISSRRFEGINKDGKDLPTGNYFYRLEIEGMKTITGYLSLKR